MLLYKYIVQKEDPWKRPMLIKAKKGLSLPIHKNSIIADLQETLGVNGTIIATAHNEDLSVIGLTIISPHSNKYEITAFLTEDKK